MAPHLVGHVPNESSKQDLAFSEFPKQKKQHRFKIYIMEISVNKKKYYVNIIYAYVSLNDVHYVYYMLYIYC